MAFERPGGKSAKECVGQPTTELARPVRKSRPWSGVSHGGQSSPTSTSLSSIWRKGSSNPVERNSPKGNHRSSGVQEFRSFRRQKPQPNRRRAPPSSRLRRTSRRRARMSREIPEQNWTVNLPVAPSDSSMVAPPHFDQGNSMLLLVQTKAGKPIGSRDRRQTGQGQASRSAGISRMEDNCALSPIFGNLQRRTPSERRLIAISPFRNNIDVTPRRTFCPKFQFVRLSRFHSDPGSAQFDAPELGSQF